MTNKVHEFNARMRTVVKEGSNMEWMTKFTCRGEYTWSKSIALSLPEYANA